MKPAEEDHYDQGGYDDFAGPPSDDDEGDVTGVTDGALGVDVAAEWAELASSGTVNLTLDANGEGAAPMTYEELCQVSQPLARAKKIRESFFGKTLSANHDLHSQQGRLY